MTETLEQLIYSARRVRFEELVKAWGGNKPFADELEKRLKAYPGLVDGGLASFMDATYISNARKGRKNIGEASALQLEMLFGKDPGWMTGDAFEHFLIQIRRHSKAG